MKSEYFEFLIMRKRQVSRITLNIPREKIFLLQLSDKINNFLRFGDEYQNFILTLISRKTQNNTILIEK
jgi:hypothetical protein